ncbi:hypothetical protein RJ639_009708 [Escallonia herrerae]|uniref:Armadillo-like repeats domain-containing protein n=1 Tax=Escallonia herrerae TaxID=1293975 RepID=A0AA88VPA9_9ASTE|nr:hypothetical protein RJ639_009708 [Escallonia herrerae]
MSGACNCAAAASPQCFPPRLSPSLSLTPTRITANTTSKLSSLNYTNYVSHTPFSSSSSLSLSTNFPLGRRKLLTAATAASTTNSNPVGSNSSKDSKKKQQEEITEEEQVQEEEEEELPWIQEKALDLVEFTGSVSQAIPGPRVGHTSFPWILALPLAYVGVSFVLAFVKTVQKFNSPKAIRRKLGIDDGDASRRGAGHGDEEMFAVEWGLKVNKNALLCKSMDELFEKGNGVQQSALMELVQKTGFNMEEILRKYIRYALNEKPFNPEFVANLIQLRKASLVDDSQVAEIVNEISRRIVKDKGPVVMDMSGYSERGFKRKLAVQALFGKIYYLSELPEFCSRDSSLIVKEIFGVADEDAEKLRIHAVSEAGDMESLEKMVDGSDSEESVDGSKAAP